LHRSNQSSLADPILLASCDLKKNLLRGKRYTSWRSLPGYSQVIHSHSLTIAFAESERSIAAVFFRGKKNFTTLEKIFAGLRAGQQQSIG